MGAVVTFDYTPEFLRCAKALSKKYRSFANDIKDLCDEIVKNPNIGDDLGNGIRKLRMAIKSKGKGKRGGARVISLTAIVDEQQSKFTFLYVYDKSEMVNLSNEKIKEILANNNLGQ